MAAATPLSPVKTLKLRNLFKTQLECEDALSDSLGSGLTPETPVDWLEPGVWDQRTPRPNLRPIDIALGTGKTNPVPYKINWRLMVALLRSHGKPGGLLRVDAVPKGYIQEGLDPFQDLVTLIALRSSSLDQTPADQIFFLREAIRGFVSAADLTKPMEQRIKRWTPFGHVLDRVSTESESLIKILLNEKTITKIPDCCTVPVQIFFAGIYSVITDKDRKGELLTEAGKAIYDGSPLSQSLSNLVSLYAFGFDAVTKYLLRHMVDDPAWHLRCQVFGESEADKGTTREYPNFVPNVFRIIELCSEADQIRARNIAQTESKTAADISALQQKLSQQVYHCDQEGLAIATDAQSIYASITPVDHVARGDWEEHQVAQFVTQFVPRFAQYRMQLPKALLVLKRDFPSSDASPCAAESFTLNPRRSGGSASCDKLNNFKQRVCQLGAVQKRLEDIMAMNQRLMLLAAPTEESEHKKQKESKEQEERKRAPSGETPTPALDAAAAAPRGM